MTALQSDITQSATVFQQGLLMSQGFLLTSFLSYKLLNRRSCSGISPRAPLKIKFPQEWEYSFKQNCCLIAKGSDLSPLCQSHQLEREIPQVAAHCLWISKGACTVVENRQAVTIWTYCYRPNLLHRAVDTPGCPISAIREWRELSYPNLQQAGEKTRPILAAEIVSSCWNRKV